MAVDMCLSQLKGIMEGTKVYAPSTFFEEQLTAFEVWLSQGSEERLPPEQLPIVLQVHYLIKTHILQLSNHQSIFYFNFYNKILLIQVLLSQAHRLRALDLLGRFLDLGPWAVNLVLSVGIYPYVLKLLQANARRVIHC